MYGENDYFLKIEGVPGESKDGEHKDEIEVDRFGCVVRQAVSASNGGGLGAGRAEFHDFYFRMRTSKATPKLFLACATGQHFNKAVLVCRKAGGKQEEYLKITLSEVLVSSFQNTVVTDEETSEMIDCVTLRFAKYEEEYKEQKADGSLSAPVKVGYDLKARKKL